MTDQTVVTALIEEFRKFSPTAASVLIDERDAYLAGSILKTIQMAGSGKKIVVVIGAGHRQGVIDYLHTPAKIPELSTLTKIPKKRFSLLKMISYGIIALVLLAFAYIIYSVITYPEMTPDVLFLAFGCWFLINGVLSAAGVLIAGGRFKSAVTAFLLAWFTSINPLVAAGWFAGLVEAGSRKPTTKDMKNMISAETFKELNSNPFFKVIYVAALANVGSMIGTFIGAYVVLKLSGIDIIDIMKTIIFGLF
jgi:pheromone shutdown-related protein TraB